MELNKHIVLISKDVLLFDYLEPYGGKYWKTPNISDLAKNGTIFKKHYTAAPSTAMAFTSMFTGLYPYQLDRANYIEVNEYNKSSTMFDDFHQLGYKCHIIWSNNYNQMARKFSKCYGKYTIFHDNIKLNQSVGPNNQNNVNNNEEIANQTTNAIINTVESIDITENIFLWIHLPHVLLGRAGYGQDIDLFDNIVGLIKKKFYDADIYITADHGHMNGEKGRVCYGFDVYDRAIRIPLITPKINGHDVIDFPTSNIQLREIILKNTITKPSYIVSDSAYYAQPHRKIAIIYENYKFIYNKLNKKEEMYDLEWDLSESNNLLELTVYDKDRRKQIIKKQVIFYPYFEYADIAYSKLKCYFVTIWKVGSFIIELKVKVRNLLIRIPMIQKLNIFLRFRA